MSPVRPLGDRKFAAGALYGVVPVGPTPETALTIVWLPKAAGGPELWLDANGDGQLTDDERHVMKGRELEIPATITIQLKPKPKKVERTLVFRRSALGDGLRYTVRGYMQGRLSLGGKEYATLLIDGNANGCFDTVGQDRVWIDLNQDGRFDPLTRAISLGQADYPQRRSLRDSLRRVGFGGGCQSAQRRPRKAAADAGQETGRRRPKSRRS